MKNHNFLSLLDELVLIAEKPKKRKLENKKKHKISNEEVIESIILLLDGDEEDHQEDVMDVNLEVFDEEGQRDFIESFYLLDHIERSLNQPKIQKEKHKLKVTFQEEVSKNAEEGDISYDNALSSRLEMVGCSDSSAKINTTSSET